MKGLGCQTCFQVQALEVCHRATRLRRLKGWLRKTASKNVTSTSFILPSPSIPFAFLFFCTKKNQWNVNSFGIPFFRPSVCIHASMPTTFTSKRRQSGFAKSRAKAYIQQKSLNEICSKYVQNIFEIFDFVWFSVVSWCLWMFFGIFVWHKITSAMVCEGLQGESHQSHITCPTFPKPIKAIRTQLMFFRNGFNASPIVRRRSRMAQMSSCHLSHLSRKSEY